MGAKLGEVNKYCSKAMLMSPQSVRQERRHPIKIRNVDRERRTGWIPDLKTSPWAQTTKTAPRQYPAKKPVVWRVTSVVRCGTENASIQTRGASADSNDASPTMARSPRSQAWATRNAQASQNTAVEAPIDVCPACPQRPHLPKNPQTPRRHNREPSDNRPPRSRPTSNPKSPPKQGSRSSATPSACNVNAVTVSPYLPWTSTSPHASVRRQRQSNSECGHLHQGTRRQTHQPIHKKSPRRFAHRTHLTRSFPVSLVSVTFTPR